MSGFPRLEIVDKLRQLITVHDRVMSWTSLLSAFTNPKLRHERAPGNPGDSGRGHGVDTSRCLRREFTAAPSYLTAASTPEYLLAIECQQRQLLDARLRGEREVVSLKILDAKEDLQRENLALAFQSAAISRLGPAVAG